MKKQNEIFKTDGKRRVGLHRGEDNIDLSFCKNGYQTHEVAIDDEMLTWLLAVIAEHFLDRKSWVKAWLGECSEEIGRHDS